MSPIPMRIEDAIIYEDRKEHIYMISEGKGYITRRATIEDLLSMNQARMANGLDPVEYRLDWVSRTSTADELRETLRAAKEVSRIRKVKTPCPNCGANSWLSGHCEYCGTEEES